MDKNEKIKRRQELIMVAGMMPYMTLVSKLIKSAEDTIKLSSDENKLELAFYCSLYGIKHMMEHRKMSVVETINDIDETFDYIHHMEEIKNLTKK